MSSTEIPAVGTRSHMINGAVADFFANHPELELGGNKGFAVERRIHMETFALHKIPKVKVNPIGTVEFTAIRGPHGTIPIRILYPSSGEHRRRRGQAGALVYFHGGGFSVGAVDEFENGLRLVAEESECQIYAIEYRLAPEFRYPTQLDEYSAVIDWLQNEGSEGRGVHPDRIAGGGDAAGGNITAAVCLRRLDEGKKALAAQVLLYPASRLPFDTPAARENNSGCYLECNGIFGFINNYLPRPNGPSVLDRYVSPGMQDARGLLRQPPAAIFTNGYDPVRDVGIEYANDSLVPSSEECHARDCLRNELHQEIWVFDNGHWTKSKELYESIRKASWDAVILEEGMKKAIIADHLSSFESRETYDRLKTMYDRKDPVPALYVRSFSSFAGPEYAIGQIFHKARQFAPCYLIFEDLDSLVSDSVRSYFLNEIDGIKSNDGIFMKRPSRFDRKYYFPDPDLAQHNKDLKFPEKLCRPIAEITHGFSFAYIQEAFVAALLVIARDAERAVGDDLSGGSDVDDSWVEVTKPRFTDHDDLDNYLLWVEIKKQVAILREGREGKVNGLCMARYSPLLELSTQPVERSSNGRKDTMAGRFGVDEEPVQKMDSSSVPSR
ncbi:hypothetical protein VTK26DRAFT_1454 [Humicola hyalothermophila]